MRASLIGICLLYTTVVTGCDTGFGQPCEMPASPEVSSACTPPPMNNNGDEQGTEQTYKVTCAVDNYPTCSTQSCLIYRGSSPYCSQRCTNNSDCFGNGVCCPLFGECNATINTPPIMSMPPVAGQPATPATPATPAVAGNGCGEPGNPCYCIRQKDFIDE